MILATGGRQPVRVAETSVGQEVTVSGRLDVTSVDEVRLKLYDILDRGVGDLLVHLAQTEVHDAAVLGVIVGLHHRARRLGRRLVLVDVSPRLDRLLRASRLHRVLARGPGADNVAMRPVTRAVPPAETGSPFSDAAQSPEKGAPPTVSREPGTERPSEDVAPVTGAADPVTEDVAPVTDAADPVTDAVAPVTDTVLTRSQTVLPLTD